MEHQRVRKTYRYKLMPTPAQEQALDAVLWRCRDLYNAALEERQTAWERRHISVTYYQQKAELPDLKAACPEYAEVNAQVLQDVMLRVERTFQAFFRRVKHGEQGKKPGYPRFRGRGRYNSFTYPQYGGGAFLDGGILSLSKIGRIRIRLHRPLQGTSKTVTISREADGWYACLSCAEVPAQPLPPTGQETGIDVGLKVILITADGEGAEKARRTHVTTARRRNSLPGPNDVSRVGRRAPIGVGRPSPCSSGSTRRLPASGATSSTRRRSRCSGSMTRSISKICRSAIWCGTVVSPRASAMPGGHNSAPSSRAKQHTLASGSSRFLPSTPARTVAAVGSVCPRA